MAGPLKRMATYLKAKGLSALLPVIAKRPRLMGALLDRFQTLTLQRMRQRYEGPPEGLESKVRAGKMFLETVKKRYPSFSPATKRKLIQNLYFNNIQIGDARRMEYKKKYGEDPPFLFIVSPTMRCNLRCDGCWASEYDTSNELTKEEVIDLVRQAKEDLGIYLVTMTGGEPTIWPPLFEVCEHHSDVTFQIYTNAVRIDDEMADRIARAGNIYPVVSIEGDEGTTDDRRGQKTYGRAVAAMERMRDRGIFFGIAVTHTRKNHEAITADGFIDRMIELGASFGWYFHYIPVGRAPSADLVPTAEQRLGRIEAVEHFRTTRPIVLYDFWNDGEAVLGCMAWGKKYFHVNNHGWVEPCVFIHFAKDNIREKRLLEIIQSSYLRDARSQMPFGGDNRRPCPVIDHPEIMPELVKKYGLTPTHADAGQIMEDAAELRIHETAREYKEALDRAGAALHGLSNPFDCSPVDAAEKAGVNVSAKR